MTRRYITPPNFDIHKSAIDGDDEDPWGYSRLDRMDGLGPPLPTVRRVHVEPKRSRTVVSVADEQYQRRDSRYKSLWLGFWTLLGLVAFVVGYLVVNGVPA